MGELCELRAGRYALETLGRNHSGSSSHLKSGLRSNGYQPHRPGKRFDPFTLSGGSEGEHSFVVHRQTDVSGRIRCRLLRRLHVAFRWDRSLHQPRKFPLRERHSSRSRVLDAGMALHSVARSAQEGGEGSLSRRGRGALMPDNCAREDTYANFRPENIRSFQPFPRPRIAHGLSVSLPSRWTTPLTLSLGVASQC